MYDEANIVRMCHSATELYRLTESCLDDDAMTQLKETAGSMAAECMRFEVATPAGVRAQCELLLAWFAQNDGPEHPEFMLPPLRSALRLLAA